MHKIWNTISPQGAWSSRMDRTRAPEQSRHPRYTKIIVPFPNISSFHFPDIILYNFVDRGIAMGMLENMAEMIRMLKQYSGKSVGEFSADLDISPSTLQEYLSGKGNPTISMIEHLAEKLGVDPLALVSGKIEPELLQIVFLLLDTIQAVAGLPQPRRLKFAELFLEIVQLWEVQD